GEETLGMRQQLMAGRSGSGAQRCVRQLSRLGGGVLAAWALCGTVYAQDCSPVSTIERLSIASDGTQGNASSEIPALSANGCIVGFKSFATNLITLDTNDKVDVFVRDRGAGTTQRIPSVLFSGTEPKDNSYPPAFDASGDLVGFG